MSPWLKNASETEKNESAARSRLTHPQRPPPVEERRDEQQAQRQPDVERVEVAAERAGVAARHRPRDLDARVLAEHAPVGGADDHLHELLVAGVERDLPLAARRARDLRERRAGGCARGCARAAAREAIAVACALVTLAGAPAGASTAERGDARSATQASAADAASAAARSGRRRAARRRRSTTARARASPSRPQQISGACESPGRQRAVAAAADVRGAAPVGELDAVGRRQQHLAGLLARERVPDPPERVGEVAAAQRPPRAQRRARAPPRAPLRRQRRPRRSPTSSPGAKRSCSPAALDDRLAVLAPDHVLDAVDAAAPARATRSTHRRAAEDVDHRRALRRADRDLRRPRAAAGRSAGGRRSRRSGRRARRSARSACGRGRRRRSPRGSSRNSSSPPGRLEQPRRAGGRPARSPRPARRDRAGASGCRCRGARAAGSRRGRGAPGTRRRSRRAGRGRPGIPSVERQPVSRLAKMSA